MTIDKIRAALDRLGDGPPFRAIQVDEEGEPPDVVIQDRNGFHVADVPWRVDKEQLPIGQAIVEILNEAQQMVGEPAGRRASLVRCQAPGCEDGFIVGAYSGPVGICPACHGTAAVDPDRRTESGLTGRIRGIIDELEAWSGPDTNFPVVSREGAARHIRRMLEDALHEEGNQ